MGELLPCPFCGGDAEISQIGNEATKTRGYEVKCRTFGCSTTKRSMVVKHTLAKAREWAVERWNARPRTEGRGEGEPVAWQEAAEPFFRLAREVINPVNGERPWHADSKDWMVVFSFAGQSVTLGDLRRAAYASPIREPEISRTALIETMRQHIKADAVGLAPAVIAHCLVGFEEAADAILNLAPVGGRGEGSKALADVAAERQRQMEVEGWTPEHDDGHGGDLLTAAVCYAQRRMDEDRFGVFANYAPAAWPWDSSWWKPKDRRRDLIRAAALLVAEIERLDRHPVPLQEQGGMK